MSEIKAKSSSKKIEEVKNEENEFKPRYPLYFLFVAIIVAAVIVAEIFTNMTVEDITLASVSYVETGAPDYTVTYNDNPVLIDKYITSGKTYMAQYIDTINAKFNYQVNYTDKVSGGYSYYVTAKLVAYTPGDVSDDLWVKDYILSDKESVDFVQEKGYLITKDIDIDFRKYLEDYNQFRNSSAVSSQALLFVEFHIQNDGRYNGVDDFKYNSVMSIEVPLGEATFKINTSKKLSSGENVISNIVSNDDDKLFKVVVSSLCWILAALVAVILIVVYRNDTRRESAYRRKLKKIINTYDSIIVNVQELPKLDKLSVVNVTSFEELVDAQNEVRLPINYVEDKRRKCAKFVLVRNNLAWVYTLKEKDLK